jgi:hypothetical protein
MDKPTEPQVRVTDTADIKVLSAVSVMERTDAHLMGWRAQEPDQRHQALPRISNTYV